MNDFIISADMGTGTKQFIDPKRRHRCPELEGESIEFVISAILGTFTEGKLILDDTEPIPVNSYIYCNFWDYPSEGNVIDDLNYCFKCGLKLEKENNE